MAVSNIVPIRFLPWNVGVRPGDPSGMWVGVASVIMDASGGVAEAQLQFQAAGSPLQAILYHVGQLFVNVPGNFNVGEVQIKTQEMGWGPGAALGTGFPWQVNIGATTINDAGTSETALPWNQVPKNILLGTPLPSSDPAVLEAIHANVDGDILTLAALGYWWSQRALGEVGAPRLPEGAIWGKG